MSLTHQSETIRLNKLCPSHVNVRKTGCETGIEELAASVATVGLLKPLTVAPKIGKNGRPNGKFAVIAGAGGFAALRLLVKQKRLDKATPISCVPIAGVGTEISLAENVTEAPMHPADQYEAFAALRAQGMTAEEIGARFGLSARMVKQRLRLGAASPSLMALYREGDIKLNQLMALRVWSSEFEFVSR